MFCFCRAFNSKLVAVCTVGFPLQDEELSLFPEFPKPFTVHAEHSHEGQSGIARTPPCSVPAMSLLSSSPVSPRPCRMWEPRMLQLEWRQPRIPVQPGNKKQLGLGSVSVSLSRASHSRSAARAAWSRPSICPQHRPDGARSRVAIPTQVLMRVD